jgi:hypothetical protein
VLLPGQNRIQRFDSGFEMIDLRGHGLNLSVLLPEPRN